MKTSPLKPIPETPQGVGITAEFMNSIIDRIEDILQEIESR